MNQIIPFDLQIQHSPYFNYTFCLNQYPFLQSIAFRDVTEDFENLNLQISSSLGLFKNTMFILIKSRRMHCTKSRFSILSLIMLC